MAHAENRVTINRPPQDVFEFLANGLNEPLWRTGIKEIALKSGSPGAVGAVYSQTLGHGPGGRSVAGDYQIVDAVPGRLLRFQVVAGPARPTGEYRLRETDGGTEVWFTLDATPRGLMKLMGPMITKTMAAEVARLSELKKVLEAAPEARG